MWQAILDRRWGRPGGIVGGDLAFDLRDPGERLVPARLQFASHQAVGRVGSVVLPEGTVSRIARGFEITLEGLTHLVSPLTGPLVSGDGRRDGTGAYDREKSILNSVINP